MAEFTEYAPGTFCWVDTGSTDVGRAKHFYMNLFGWTERTDVDPNGTPYTMFLKDGKPVAGLFPAPAGSPSFWLGHVAVADADASCEAILAAGGRPMMGGVVDVSPTGRMCPFIDPTGAAASVWEAGEHVGAGLANEHGSFGWNELLTNDVEAARAFYQSVFGWEHDVQEMPGGPYHLFKDGDRFRAGMMAITPEMGPMPPNWSVYFTVDDIDAALEAVRALGGAVEAEITPAPGVGKIAVVRSADGAYFDLMQPE